MVKVDPKDLTLPNNDKEHQQPVAIYFCTPCNQLSPIRERGRECGSVGRARDSWSVVCLCVAARKIV